MELRLFIELDPSEHASTYERELRRRVWFYVFILDKMCVSGLFLIEKTFAGTKPSTICAADTYVYLPCSEHGILLF